MKKLTILIPTYNRKDYLLSTLKNIFCNGHLGEYDLVISDNHSDYDIKKEIETVFSSDFTSNITINQWPFNVGMSTNLAISFFLPKTHWCLMLSDDDVLNDHLLDKVFLDIEKYDSSCAIKYSIEGCEKHIDGDLQNISDFSDYYKDKRRAGDKMYLAMLYNLQILHPYLSYMTIYSYTYLSFLVALLKCLEEKKGGIHTSSFIAFHYQVHNEVSFKKSQTSYLRTVLGIRTIDDVIMTFKGENRKKLKKAIFTDVIEADRLYKSLVQIEDKEEGRSFYKKLKNYIQNKGIKTITFKTIYNLYYYTNINLFTIIDRVRNRKKRLTT